MRKKRINDVMGVVVTAINNATGLLKALTILVGTLVGLLLVLQELWRAIYG